MIRLKELRQAAGMTQDQLGKKLGTARSTVSQYETGDRQLDPATICVICDLFNCSADYLLCRSESPDPAISDEDSRILAAYHDADPRDRDFIDHLLKLDEPNVAAGKAVS